MAAAEITRPVRGTVDGLGVSIAQVPHARTVSVTLVRPAGWSSELPGQAGFAHLVEHLVHQAARGKGQVTVEASVSSVGGLSNAQTYPFHTEFTLVVPAGGISQAASWFQQALAWSRWPEVSAAQITREVRVISQEVTHRFASSPVGGFPWIDALSTLNDDFALTHDGFSDLTDLQAAAPAALRSFWDRGSADSVVAVATPWAPREVADVLGLVPTVPSASTPVGWPEKVRPRRRGLSVPSRFPVQATVRVLPDVGAPDLTRAHALLVAGVLDHDDRGGTWQSGVFGAFLGPDYRIVLRRSLLGPGTGEPSFDVSRAVAEHLPSALRNALADLDLRLSGTVTASAILARDHAFGVDPYTTRACLVDATPEAITASAQDLLHVTPGLVGAVADVAVPA